MKKTYIPYLFLLPALFFIGVFVIYPILHAFYFSMFDLRVVGQKTIDFIGFRNFKRLLIDNERTWEVVQNSLTYTVLVTAGTVLIGLFLALLLDNEVKGWRVFRVVFFLPVMLAAVIVAKLWMAFYDPHHGLFNELLRELGLGHLEQVWLGDHRIALYSIIAISIWQYSGYTMVFFVAALQNIPPDVKEAARIDGLSNPFSIARHISIPLISPVIVTVIMLQIIGTLKIFDIIWATTKGGPGVSTTVLSIMMYREAFLRNNFGYAQTIAVFMFLLVLVVSLVYLRIARFGKELQDPT